jgi:hypothetical protein
MTASSYDKSHVDMEGRHAPLSSEVVKFDIITYDMGSAATVEEWVKQYRPAQHRRRGDGHQ